MSKIKTELDQLKEKLKQEYDDMVAEDCIGDMISFLDRYQWFYPAGCENQEIREIYATAHKQYRLQAIKDFQERIAHGF